MTMFMIILCTCNELQYNTCYIRVYVIVRLDLWTIAVHMYNQTSWPSCQQGESCADVTINESAKSLQAL